MSLRPGVWYPRLAAVPGLDFAGSPGVDRTLLAEHDSVPQVSEYGLWWTRRTTTRGGVEATSASPAHERAFGIDTSHYSSSHLIVHVWETVELPGAPEDYHFALQHAAEQLWRTQSTNPESLSSLETFAWLDLALVEAAPWALMYASEDRPPTMAALPGIDRLIVLLEREGAHREALSVATRLVALGAHTTRLDRIQTRIATLDAFA